MYEQLKDVSYSSAEKSKDIVDFLVEFSKLFKLIFSLKRERDRVILRLIQQREPI